MLRPDPGRAHRTSAHRRGGLRRAPRPPDARCVASAPRQRFSTRRRRRSRRGTTSRGVSLGLPPCGGRRLLLATAAAFEPLDHGAPWAPLFGALLEEATGDRVAYPAAFACASLLSHALKLLGPTCSFNFPARLPHHRPRRTARRSRRATPGIPSLTVVCAASDEQDDRDDDSDDERDNADRASAHGTPPRLGPAVAPTLPGSLALSPRVSCLRPDLPTSEEREEIKALSKEVYELRRANEILKAASVLSRPSSMQTERTEPPH